jgi:hypothetical protein
MVAETEAARRSATRTTEGGMSHHACAVRLLTAADARLSYPLMVLHQPSLTLRRWQSMLRAIDRQGSARLFGVLNPGGCLMAIIRVKGEQFDMLAEPPPLLGDSRQILEAVAALVRGSCQTLV